MLSKILTTAGSIVTIAFGAWHFAVPTLWRWYDYIKPEATELVLAVRATNLFFSLSLVLIGITNIIFVFGKSNKFSLIAMLSLSSVLWVVRCLMQIAYPQGTMNPALQYGMLAAFILVFCCFFISLILIAVKNQTAA